MLSGIPISHDAGELGRVAVDALRVLAGACVLGIERTRQRAHGLAVRALEQAPLPALELQKVTQVAGVEEQLLIREAPSGRAVRGAVQSARQALDHCEQLERAERLQHERIRADLAGDRLVRLVGAGQEDDRDVARRGRPLQDGAERHAVLSRHAHVEHDRVGTRLDDPLPSLVGIGGLVHVDVDRFESRSKQCPQTIVVVYDQEADGASSFPVRAQLGSELSVVPNRCRNPHQTCGLICLQSPVLSAAGTAHSGHHRARRAELP